MQASSVEHINVRVTRKELTSINKSLETGQCVLVCFVDKQPTIYSAEVETQAPLLTFAFSDTTFDVTTQGLPANRFTIDKQYYQKLFALILGGKSVKLKNDGNTITHTETTKKAGSPVLLIDYSTCQRGTSP
jgi:hypothetical protein